MRLTVASVELLTAVSIGTLDGVTVDAVAARNEEGLGYLRAGGESERAIELQWRAPGSATFGPRVACDESLVASYLLLDGEDSNKWVRVTVYPDFFRTFVSEDAQVQIRFRYAVGVADDDVTAAEAAAGSVETYQIDMDSASVGLFGLRVWIDPAVAGLEISDDGAAWVSPTTEGAALLFPPVMSSDVLHVRRTILPAASPDPDILNLLHFRWDSL